jgi:hypothetical protein
MKPPPESESVLLSVEPQPLYIFSGRSPVLDRASIYVIGVINGFIRNITRNWNWPCNTWSVTYGLRRKSLPEPADLEERRACMKVNTPMRHESDRQKALPIAIWVSGGVALIGFLLIVCFFYWASEHDSGDGDFPYYPIALTHGVLGGLVIASLLVAWSIRRSGTFRIIHLFPFTIAVGYAGIVIFFCLQSLL